MMRADVKFGIVLSMVVVFVAGGYYLYRDKQELPIPLTDASQSINKKAPVMTPAKTTKAARNNSPQVAQRKNVPAKTPAIRNRQNNSNNIPAANLATGNQATPVTRINPALPNRNGLNGPTQATRRQNPAEVNTHVVDGNQPAPLNGQMRSTVSPTTEQSKPSVANSIPVQNQSRSLMAKSPIPTVTLETHRVQPGDSFASLAKMYYGSENFTQYLMSQNPQITNPNALKIGAVITIPPAPAPQQDIPSSPVTTSANQASSKVYIVRSGDSFYRIAEQQLGDANRWEELFNLNKNVVKGDPKKLRPGQKIVLP